MIQQKSRELALILGDAAGAFFEFRMNIPQSGVDNFFETFEYKFGYFKRDTKRDWTDDTDQLILKDRLLGVKFRARRLSIRRASIQVQDISKSYIEVSRIIY